MRWPGAAWPVFRPPNDEPPLPLSEVRRRTASSSRELLPPPYARLCQGQAFGGLQNHVRVVDHNEEKLGLISAKRKSFWSNHKPASTLIPVPRLASDEMLFEIDAVAVVGNS